MKMKKLVLMLTALLALVLTLPTLAAAEANGTIEYQPSSGKYPVIYVMPDDGLTDHSSGIARQLAEQIRSGKMIEAMIVKTTFSADSANLHADMAALVKKLETNEKYKDHIIALPMYRAIVGTGVGGYMAYALGMTAQDNGAAVNDPETFAFVASVNGNFVDASNIWYNRCGDVYTKLKNAGASVYDKYFTYLDAPVGGEWTNQENSSNDLGALFIGAQVEETENEFTVRQLEGALSGFVSESVKRIAGRMNEWVITSVASGTIELGKTVYESTDTSVDVTYALNITDKIGAVVADGKTNASLIVDVVDPQTNKVLASQTKKIAIDGANTYTGTITVNGYTSQLYTAAVKFSISMLGTKEELDSANVVRGRGTVIDGSYQLLDLMGDWYFKYYGTSKIDVLSLEESEYKTWDKVLPGLGNWVKGYGNINETTVDVPYWAGWYGLGFNDCIVGSGYYVKEFTIPANFSSEELVLYVGYCDDMCEVWLNGKRIGAKGMDESGNPMKGTYWALPYEVELTQADINRGGKNVLVVRNYNNGYGGGGWYKGPVRLYSKAAHAAEHNSGSARFYEETFTSSWAASALGESGTIENKYLIYLPEGYDKSDRYYPTLYLMHQYQSDHISYRADEIDRLMDEGIASGLFDEMIVVVPNSDVESWWRGDWLKMITEELIPHIDSNYRTIKDARYRFTAGCSMGGQGAFGVALQNPDFFSGAVSFYGAFDVSMSGNASPLNIAKNETAEYMDNFAMYFICGNQDTWDFGDDAIELNQMLEKMGVDHYFFIENGYHDSAFYLPNYEKAIQYVWENMYDETELKDQEPDLSKMAYASLEKTDDGLALVFAADELLAKYFNQLPKSNNYEYELNPALNIPLRITVTQNGREYRMLLRDHMLKPGAMVSVVDNLKAEDFAQKARSGAAFDPQKKFTYTIEATIFDNEWVKLYHTPEEMLGELNLPETGDHSSLMLYAALMMAAMGAIGMMMRRKSRA